MKQSDIIKAIAVTSEVMGNEMTEDAAKMMLADLSGFPPMAVAEALKRVRREVKGRLCVADIIRHIDDGRPGVEEAWAMMPRSESETVVWTEEMAMAFGSVYRLLEEGDKIAARMAFRERYTTLCTEAKSNGEPVKWNASLGHDPTGRVPALAAAVAAGKITNDKAKALCCDYEEPEGKVLTLAVQSSHEG